MTLWFFECCAVAAVEVHAKIVLAESRGESSGGKLSATVAVSCLCGRYSAGTEVLQLSVVGRRRACGGVEAVQVRIITGDISISKKILNVFFCVFLCFSVVFRRFFCRNELRLIEEAEAEEIEQKSREQNEAVEEQRLSTCFVEGLNEYHFFDILFVGDNSAKVLLMVEGTNDILKT